MISGKLVISIFSFGSDVSILYCLLILLLWKSFSSSLFKVSISKSLSYLFFASMLKAKFTNENLGQRSVNKIDLSC